MEEGIKSRLILILAILTAIFFLTSVSSCMDSRRQRTSRYKEMSTRMGLEEKAEKFNSERAALSDKIKELEKNLGSQKGELEKTKEALSQQQLANRSLTEELEKVNKLKEALEENLKEALVSGASKRNK